MIQKYRMLEHGDAWLNVRVDHDDMGSVIDDQVMDDNVYPTRPFLG